jgi:hypothetical protein
LPEIRSRILLYSLYFLAKQIFNSYSSS